MNIDELNRIVRMDLRHNKMLREEYRIEYEHNRAMEIELKEIKEEEIRNLEENNWVMREVQRRKCLENDHELEKQHAYNKREHNHLLVEEGAFIEEDERN